MVRPLVSVAVAARDEARYVRASVQSLLDQTYPSLEIWVVDDGSTDGTWEELQQLEDPRLRCVRQPSSGKAAALNRIIELAGGEYLMIHDADDLSAPRRAEVLVERMEQEPDLGACFSQFELLAGGRRFAGRSTGLDRAACAALIAEYRQPSIDPTILVRMALARRLRFAPELRIGQGVDFVLRVGEEHPMVVVEDCLYGYRVHRRSTTRRRSGQTAAYSHLVRQRAAARRGERPPAGPARVRGHVAVSQSVESVLDDRVTGARRRALRTALWCAALAPFEPAHYKPTAYALAPTPLLRRLRPDRTPTGSAG